MKIVVAGPRNYKNKKFIDWIMEKYIPKDSIVITGGASGVDFYANLWAKNNCSVEPIVVDAEWDKYGNAAGPIRNGKMASMGTHLLAFSNGSRGTSDMIRAAKKLGRKIKTIEI